MKYKLTNQELKEERILCIVLLILLLIGYISLFIISMDRVEKAHHRGFKQGRNSCGSENSKIISEHTEQTIYLPPSTLEIYLPSNFQVLNCSDKFNCACPEEVWFNFTEDCIIIKKST